MRQLIIDIDTVDATIRIFAPDIDLEEVRPKPLPPRHAAFKGEIGRAIMDALRGTGEALTTKDLALRSLPTTLDHRSDQAQDPAVRKPDTVVTAARTIGHTNNLSGSDVTKP